MTATPLVGTTFFGIDISGLGRSAGSFRRKVSKRVLLLEFQQQVVRFAEACPTAVGIQLNHIGSLRLPPEALERGIPSDPRKMAALLRDLCEEKKIPAHRAAVVLPPEAAWQRLVSLPVGLSLSQARQFVLDPANSLQIPFPLDQTDFDLSPVQLDSGPARMERQQTYLLTAIPRALVDQIVEMLEAADFELQLLEVGSLSVLRGFAADLLSLAEGEIELVLDLSQESTHLLFVNSSGLLATERLAPIRDFPDLELDAAETAQVQAKGQSAESLALASDSYLPLSELDLRVLLVDIRSRLLTFQEQFPACSLKSIRLAGHNSAHPYLKQFLVEALSLPVKPIASLLAPGLAGFSLDDLLVYASLDRLSGLALGLLPRNYWLQSDSANLIEDRADFVVEEVASTRSFEPALLEALDSNSQVLGDGPHAIPMATTTPLSRPIIEDLLEERTEELEVSSEGEMPEVVAEEEEWPRIGELEVEERQEELEVGAEEEEWPRIPHIIASEDSVELDLDATIGEPLQSSATVIRGLPIARASREDQSCAESQTVEEDPASTPSPLGELRFADSD